MTMEVTMGSLDDILLIEGGCPSEEEYIAAYQRLVNSGLVWQLQGSYGREATRLINAGLVELKHD
jgi:hypothetical protein